MLEMLGDGAYIGTSEAADLLGIDVATLRRWEQRYGFPTAPQGTPGQRRRVSRHEVLGLRNALRTEPSIPAAVARARGGTVRSSGAGAAVRRAASRRIAP